VAHGAEPAATRAGERDPRVDDEAGHLLALVRAADAPAPVRAEKSEGAATRPGRRSIGLCKKHRQGIAATLIRPCSKLKQHVARTSLGVVVAAETGFLLATRPDTVRAPDAAFVRAERVKGTIRGYFPGAPDLAVEVLSPDDRLGEVREKIREWLGAGALAVWIVDPRSRTVTVHEPERPPVRLGATQVLRGGNALPGFEIVVAEIFA